jgi:hypothetical protein
MTFMGDASFQVEWEPVVRCADTPLRDVSEKGKGEKRVQER